MKLKAAVTYLCGHRIRIPQDVISEHKITLSKEAETSLKQAMIEAAHSLMARAETTNLKHRDTAQVNLCIWNEEEGA